MDTSILKWIGASFLGISLFQYGSLIKPQKYISKNKPKTDYEEIEFFTDDGVRIAGWWIPGNENATIIVGHGYPFDKGNIYQGTRWLHPKFNLLYYDHRSFGESGGSITTGGIKEVKDIEAAIQYVKERTNGTIGLFGFSLSAAAMLMANHINVQAIVADSSYTSVNNVLKHIFAKLGFLRWPFIQAGHVYAMIFGVNLSQSPICAVKHINTPTLLIHGEADTQTPVENAEQLYQASNKDYVDLLIIPDADHGETLLKRQTIRTVRKFFEEHLLSKT